MIKRAWMPNRIVTLSAIAWATLTAASIHAQTHAPSQSESASTVNQSLSLEDAAHTRDPARSDAAGHSERAENVSSGDQDHPPGEQANALVLPPRGGTAQVARGGETAAPSGPVDIKSLASLFIVLALMAGAVYVLRRFVPVLRTGDHAALRVVARAGLSSKHSLALVRLGRRYVLLGMGGDGVNCLCDIDDAEEVAELSAHFGTSDRSPRAFEQLLRTELGEHKTDRHKSDPPNRLDRGDESASGLTGLRSRLRALKAG